jgi:translation initiation factor IF-3
MDLIGVHLSQTPPVVKVMDKATLNTTGQVESSKDASPQKKRQQSSDKNNNKKSNAPAVTVKEVKFKVGIAENDLVRKLQQAKSYLQKGYICQVSIFCPRRFYKAEEEEEEKEGEEVVNSTFGNGFDPNNYNIDQRIYEHVHEYLLHEPKVKRNKNLTSVVLHPKPNPTLKC